MVNRYTKEQLLDLFEDIGKTLYGTDFSCYGIENVFLNDDGIETAQYSDDYDSWSTAVLRWDTIVEMYLQRKNEAK